MTKTTNSIIDTRHLFPPLDTFLLEQLRSLSMSDWQQPTVVPKWNVHDIALHLLDGNIKALSILRDGYMGVQPGKMESSRDLVDFLNQLNADWIMAMKRLSPTLLIDLLDHTGKQFCNLMNRLPFLEPALFPVAWAGEAQSANWFHIAREYTEKWHHQQQIRHAMGNEAPLLSSTLYHPYLETSMRALPFHYQGYSAPDGSAIEFYITGEGGGRWWLHRQNAAWAMNDQQPEHLTCQIVIDGTIAWRILTNGIDTKTALSYTEITGDTLPGLYFLAMRAVMV